MAPTSWPTSCAPAQGCAMQPSAARSVARWAALWAASQAQRSAAWADPVCRRQPAPVRRSRARARGSAAIEGGRGYMLSDVAMDALQNEPQVLGRYAPQFAQAMGSNEADAVSALITRLSHTDPDFRMNVLPALRARTGGM